MTRPIDLPERAGGSSKYWILPSYAWPGGYDLTYYTANYDTLCQDCAQTAWIEWVYDLGTCEGWQHDPPVYVDSYWEGPDTYCDNCYKNMPAVYGDPDDDGSSTSLVEISQ